MYAAIVIDIAWAYRQYVLLLYSVTGKNWNYTGRYTGRPELEFKFFSLSDVGDIVLVTSGDWWYQCNWIMATTKAFGKFDDIDTFWKNAGICDFFLLVAPPW